MKKCLMMLIIFCLIFAPMPVMAEIKPDIETTSASIILINPDTGTVVYKKDADKKVNPSATTMIMTYIMASENISNADVTKITARKESIDQVNQIAPTTSTTPDADHLGIIEGEELTAQSLINAMTIGTAGDAAYVLADFIGKGNIQTFMDSMNQRAESLGCKNTHFTNPAGFYDENNTTTAEDMAIITKFAMTLPHFNDITNTTSVTIPATNKSEERTITTTNSLINEGSEYYNTLCRGIMIGSSTKAGCSAISTAVKDNDRYLCIALGAPAIVAQDNNSVDTSKALVDTNGLYQWTFNKLKLKTILTTNKTIAEIKVSEGSKKDNLALVSAANFNMTLPIEIPESEITITPHLPEKVKAPIEKGQIIGTATLSYAGEDLTEINLVASESVGRSAWVRFFEVIKIAILVILVLLLIVFIYVQIHNYRIRKKKRLRHEKARKQQRRNRS
ncbi:MAG: D-alanyl-D-alanine carboxypeptidase [Eubacterium sp.]